MAGQSNTGGNTNSSVGGATNESGGSTTVDACVPKTCADYSAAGTMACGIVSDGCSHSIDCTPVINKDLFCQQNNNPYSSCGGDGVNVKSEPTSPNFSQNLSSITGTKGFCGGNCVNLSASECNNKNQDGGYDPGKGNSNNAWFCTGENVNEHTPYSTSRSFNAANCSLIIQEQSGTLFCCSPN
jgi:hypothetical protein